MINFHFPVSLLFQRTNVFKCLAAISMELGPECLLGELKNILPPLHREITMVKLFPGMFVDCLRFSYGQTNAMVHFCLVQRQTTLLMRFGQFFVSTFMTTILFSDWNKQQQQLPCRKKIFTGTSILLFHIQKLDKFQLCLL